VVLLSRKHAKAGQPGNPGVAAATDFVGASNLETCHGLGILGNMG
jgi:hypothetical protein